MIQDDVLQNDNGRRRRGAQNDDNISSLESTLWHFFLFFILPILLLIHLYVLSENTSHKSKYTLFGNHIDSSIAWIMLGCILYGMFVTATIFYFVYLSLLAHKNAMYDTVKRVTHQYRVLEGQYRRLKSAANQIMVPYNLDKLAEKDLLEFSIENYKPGTLMASAKPQAPH